MFYKEQVALRSFNSHVDRVSTAENRKRFKIKMT